MCRGWSKTGHKCWSKTGQIYQSSEDFRFWCPAAARSVAPGRSGAPKSDAKWGSPSAFRGSLGWHPPADEKQLCHRLPDAFVASVLHDFNAGLCDAASACARLEVSRSRLYALRHRWLSDPPAFDPQPSGGDHLVPWTAEAAAFAAEFLPHCRPLNFALLADELARRLDFHRSRAAVAAWCRQHLPTLCAPAPKPGPKPRRRWQAGSIGELWQHDSSPHDWWPAATKPILILTLDDHSRKIVAGSFVPRETTWAHFSAARSAIATHGAPRAYYTDGLALFGATPHTGPDDVRSQFQRALLGLGIAHRVAPDPQAKGKIERRFGTFQNRLVSLLSAAAVTDFAPANALLAEQIAWHNARHRCRTTGLTPDHSWQLALEQNRSQLTPAPLPTLCDLHFALQFPRRCSPDHSIELFARRWPIAPSRLQTVTIVHHPERQFWVIPHPPVPPAFAWPSILAHYTL